MWTGPVTLEVLHRPPSGFDWVFTQERALIIEDDSVWAGVERPIFGGGGRCDNGPAHCCEQSLHLSP